MSTKRALTVKRVEAIKPPATGQIDVFDANLPGFGLRVSSKGRKSYVLLYRPKIGKKKGKVQRLTLGTTSTLTLAEARQKAQEWKRLVDENKDPKAIIDEQHAEAVERAENTFGVVAESFLERYCKKEQPKSWEQTAYALRELVIPVWGDRPIDSIRRRDVMDLLDDIAADRPILANRTLAYIRKLFNWCLDREIIGMTPATRIKPPGGKEKERERVLSDEEIKALWPAFEDYGYPFGPLFKALLLTGQRRGEVAGMKCSELDLEERVWNLPGERVKNSRPHVVPLAPQVVELLTSLPRFRGDHVFTTTGGDRPVAGFSRPKERIAASADVSGWAIHDLRRTAASGMARLKVPSDIISKVLNHSPVGVTQKHYDKWTYLPEKRHALEVWASHVEGLLYPVDDDKVVAIR